MRIPIRLPIAVKLAVVTIGLLLAAMVTTAFQASGLFTSVSGKREEDSNRAQADARANEVTVTLDRIVEKIIFFGPLLLKGETGSDKLVSESFGNDKDYVALKLFQRKDGETRLVRRMVNTASLGGYDLDASFLDKLDDERPFPTAEVFTGEILLKNRSIPGGAPILTLGVPLLRDDVGQVTHIAVADINLNVLQRAFAQKSERVVYLVDSQGKVLAHPDEKLMMEAADLSDLEIVRMALASKVAKGQLRYRNEEVGDHFISAYSKTRFGLSVISEAPEAIILEPAALVRRQVYLITGVVLSIALFIAFLTSLSITRPIQKLVEVTKEIARGNFEIPVARMVTTNDEVGSLAVSFDAMLAGLRERDKVKSLFAKFHGTSVTDSLLQSDKIEMGGVRKKVVVFFSDIRGFTSMSERLSPEQVVSMVNEYFDVMVKIILENHGIVDKFIGDAIMAIWGAPQSTGRDGYYAVKACLEMRKALVQLNEKRMARGDEPLRFGAGLHTGEAVSGNIGSEERMEFTVIGDTVNMTSRIEESTKAFGADLIISEDLAQEVKDHFIIQKAGSAKVKGKADVLNLYKVLGIIHEDGRQELVRTEYSDYQAEKAGKAEVV